MNFRCLFNNVVIEPDPDTKTSKGGIIIPVNSQRGFRRPFGTVKAVGPGVPAVMTGTLIPMSVKIGDRVAFGSHIMEIEDNTGKRYLICKETELLTAIENEGEEITEVKVPEKKE